MSSRAQGSVVARNHAFRTQVEPEIEVLLRVARTLTGSWADAEDLVQDTLTRAYRAIDRFDGGHPRAWLLTILRNTNMNSHRRRRPDLAGDRFEWDGQRPAFGAAVVAAPEDVVVDRIFDEVVERAAAGLDPMFRTVLLLIDVDQLTYAEVGEVLGLPVGTVMSRLSRARDKVRMQLRRDAASGGLMLSMLATMLTCRWSARRIQRYLDADPSAPLAPQEIERLQAHLATCGKCTAAASDYRGIRRVLAAWSTRPLADPDAVVRLRSTARSLMARDGT